MPQKTNFFENLFGNSNALRKEVYFENGGAIITGTAGCASFPSDSDDYSDLFSLIDKMLYLGKDGGRNCYTIYDESKHKDIEIHKIANNGIFTNMYKLKSDVQKESIFENKLLKALPTLKEILRIHDLYYVLSDGKMRAVIDKAFTADASDLPQVMQNDLYSESNLELIKKHSPNFYQSLIKNGFESVLISRIRNDKETKGYLVCAVNRSLRIWQENECAILFYLSELLAS